MSALLGSFIFYLFLSNLGSGDQSVDMTLIDTTQSASQKFPQLQPAEKSESDPEALTTVSLLDI